MSPQRIQLRRTKGWRKPEGAIVVARPSKWGNPFRVVPMPRSAAGIASADGLDVYERSVAVDLFQDNLQDAIDYPDEPHCTCTVDECRCVGPDPGGCGHCWAKDAFDPCPAPFRWMVANLAELRGHDLACWCPLDQPCHADVLIGLANGEAS